MTPRLTPAWSRCAEARGSCRAFPLFHLVSAPRSRTRDEGRSLGAGLQEQASNHLKLLWSNARVVSVKEKAPIKESGAGQGGERKRTTDGVSK